MTRAFGAMARGDWQGMLAYHPLAPLFAVELAVGWSIWGAWCLRRLQAFPLAAAQRVLVADGALLLALWLGRAAAGTLPW